MVLNKQKNLDRLFKTFRANADSEMEAVYSGDNRCNQRETCAQNVESSKIFGGLKMLEQAYIGSRSLLAKN